MAHPSPERVSADVAHDLAFSEATHPFPQSAGGVPKIIATDLRQIQVVAARSPEAAAALTRHLNRREIADKPVALRKVIRLTTAVHHLFATPDNPNPGNPNLHEAIPFAYGLVAAARRAGALGMQGIEVPQLELPTEDTYAEFERAMKNPQNIARYRKVMARTANVVHALGGEAEELADGFRTDLLLNNDDLVAGAITPKVHFERRSGLQRDLGAALYGLVETDLIANRAEGVHLDDALLAASNVLTKMPGPSLPGHYFGPPRA